MPDTVDSLILDLLEWIGPAGRPYDEVMDAWRTSCPRLPVWEEANRRGLIRTLPTSGQPQRGVRVVGGHGPPTVASASIGRLNIRNDGLDGQTADSTN